MTADLTCILCFVSTVIKILYCYYGFKSQFRIVRVDWISADHIYEHRHIWRASLYLWSAGVGVYSEYNRGQEL